MWKPGCQSVKWHFSDYVCELVLVTLGGGPGHTRAIQCIGPLVCY